VTPLDVIGPLTVLKTPGIGGSRYRTLVVGERAEPLATDTPLQVQAGRHVRFFRKTCATILDEAGLSARAVADQLGHAKPSMTQDVYLGRKIANPHAATALEAAGVTGAAE
jgi:integrase